MTNPYPIPRQLRETEALVGDGGSVYGPFDGLKIFDIEDVEVWIRPAGAVQWAEADVTVTKTSGQPFDTFSIAFAYTVADTTQFKVLSRRTAERSAGVVSGTRVDPTALEKEISKIATTLQELRRDVGRGVQVQFGNGLTLDESLQDGETLMKSGSRLVAGPSAADIELAQSYAEDAKQDREAAEEAAGVAVDAAAAAVSAQAIYSRIVFMSGINVPEGVTAIRVNGRASPGDGEGGLFIDSNNGSNDTFISGDGRTWYRAYEQISGARIEKRGALKPLVEWVGSGAYNLDWGIKIGGVQKYAPRNGVDDDSEVLNAILAQETAVVITPGIVNVKSSGLVSERPNTQLSGLGGLQAVTIQRSLDLPVDQHTMRLGSSTTANGARGARITDLWFSHPGRLQAGYTTLPSKAVGDASQLAVYGAQKGYFSIGGQGARSIVTLYGGSGNMIDRPFFYGGVWDPENSDLQESVAQIWLRYHPIHGHMTNTQVQKPEMYGSTQPGSYSRMIGTQLYSQGTAGRRAGPLYGILIESCEDFGLEGGFLGLFGFANIGFVPASATDLIFNAKIRGTFIDESHEHGIYALNNYTDAQAVNQLDLDNVTFNGQGVCRSAMNIRGDGAGGYSVRRMKAMNCKATAFAGGCFNLGGVDSGEITGLRAMGYNLANNDTSAGGSVADTSAVFLHNLTRLVEVENCRYGGGPNSEAEGNNCQWGYYDATASGNLNRYYRQKSMGLGKAGGAIAFGTVSSV